MCAGLPGVVGTAAVCEARGVGTAPVCEARGVGTAAVCEALV